MCLPIQYYHMSSIDNLNYYIMLRNVLFSDLYCRQNQPVLSRRVYHQSENLKNVFFSDEPTNKTVPSGLFTRTKLQGMFNICYKQIWSFCYLTTSKRVKEKYLTCIFFDHLTNLSSSVKWASFLLGPKLFVAFVVFSHKRCEKK